MANTAENYLTRVGVKYPLMFPEVTEQQAVLHTTLNSDVIRSWIDLHQGEEDKYRNFSHDEIKLLCQPLQTIGEYHNEYHD